MSCSDSRYMRPQLLGPGQSAGSQSINMSMGTAIEDNVFSMTIVYYGGEGGSQNMLRRDREGKVTARSVTGLKSTKITSFPI